MSDIRHFTLFIHSSFFENVEISLIVIFLFLEFTELPSAMTVQTIGEMNPKKAMKTEIIEMMERRFGFSNKEWSLSPFVMYMYLFDQEENNQLQLGKLIFKVSF